jgi:hypothetical protein
MGQEGFTISWPSKMAGESATGPSKQTVHLDAAEASDSINRLGQQHA